MAVTDPKPMSRAAAIAYAICSPLSLIALVFLPVGRLEWKPGWFVAFLVAAFGASAVILARVNPSIYRARSRFQPGTKRWDLVLVALILPAMVIEVPLATFDAGRMAWSSMPTACARVARETARIIEYSRAQEINRREFPSIVIT